MYTDIIETLDSGHLIKCITYYFIFTCEYGYITFCILEFDRVLRLDHRVLESKSLNSCRA